MDRDHIAGLEKGLRVLECFDGDTPKMTIADAAQRTGYSRAAARRCLRTLVTLGYVDFDGKYFRLLPRVLRIGYSFLSSAGLPQILQPVLNQLSEQVGETCSGSMLDGADVIYIARANQTRLISLGLTVGSRLPAYCTAAGRALLSGLDNASVRERLRHVRRLKLTDRTITSMAGLLKELDQVRRQGYCIVNQEMEIGLTTLAVPLRNREGRVVAAMNIGVPATRYSPKELVALGLEKLLNAQDGLKHLL